MGGGQSRWFSRRDVPWLPPEIAPGDGPIGVEGQLDVKTLLRAYCDGVFPWYSAGEPILWWSPDPRGIFELDAFHISRRLSRTIRSGKFQTTVNMAFEQVMRACGENRPDGTWITSDMLTAYRELHEQGYAHSIEVWCGNTLAGGVYGVAIGGFFAGESMFHRVTDASKVALAALVARLRERGYRLFDIQMVTPHTERLGATEISREEYLKRLKKALAMSWVNFADGK